ncbi:MAG: hypothetical protein M3342_23515 [Bacteroidota bacterium]|nr:hypothetical protein [Bacteroidota bacterium]
MPTGSAVVIIFAAFVDFAYFISTPLVTNEMPVLILLITASMMGALREPDAPHFTKNWRRHRVTDTAPRTGF